MKHIPDLISTAALKMRTEHKTVDLAIIKEAMVIGAGIALERVSIRMKQETELAVSIRRKSNAPQ